MLSWNVLKKTLTPGVFTDLEGSRVFKIQSENSMVPKHLNHMVNDNTDMQNLPPPTTSDSKPTELVVLDKTMQISHILMLVLALSQLLTQVWSMSISPACLYLYPRTKVPLWNTSNHLPSTSKPESVPQVH